MGRQISGEGASRQLWGRLREHSAALCVIGLAVIVYSLCIDYTASWSDSAVYLVGAKALATGQGYKLISHPPPAPTPIYPPGFSALLAPVWWVVPSYPTNLPWIKIVSLFAAALYGWLGYRILRDHGACTPLAVAALAMALLHTLTVQMVGATVLSDLTFAAITLAGLRNLEIDASQSKVTWRTWAVALQVAASILVRAAGVSLWLFGLLYLARQRASGAKFLVLAAAGLALIWYLPRSGPAVDVRAAEGPYSASYFRIYRYSREPGGELRERGAREIAQLLLGQHGRSAIHTLENGIAEGRTGFWFDLLKSQLDEKRGIPVASILGASIAVLTLIGIGRWWTCYRRLIIAFVLITYLVAASAPFDPVFIPRYLIPGGIFLNYFFLLGLSIVTGIGLDLIKKPSDQRPGDAPALQSPGGGAPKSSRLQGGVRLCLCIAVIFILPNAAYAVRHAANRHGLAGSPSSYYRTADERLKGYQQIRKIVPQSDIVAASDAGEVFLMTERHSLPLLSDRLDYLEQNGVRWILAAPGDSFDVTGEMIRRGVSPAWVSESGAFKVYFLPTGSNADQQLRMRTNSSDYGPMDADSESHAFVD